MPQAQKLPNLMKDEKYGSAEQIMALTAAKLVAIIQDPAASTYAKAKACMRLAVVGGRSAVPAVAPLLVDAQLSHYARFALEPNPDPSASDVLRTALTSAKGATLVGIINSLGHRRDGRALPTLERLRHDADLAVADAADAAMGRIRPAL